ncbi:MAG: glutaredoxin family protein [Proteobacteria bacterium]|uniref:glutaredoxin family protein n=1 Tax=Aquabacterium sp. TaxID=1872578 RepID=UPI0035C709DC|nr:glutaredoxin family protein [Pseudomonadota bacterium]
MRIACLPRRALLALLPVLASLASPAWALYKVVGPDGRVTYTDRPPSDRPAKALKAGGASQPTDGLPFELQQLVTRFPVTLFTGANCTPCDAGRQLLQARGVPFTEKTVNTSDDIRRFRDEEGSSQLPTLRIGQKRLTGLQQSEWTAYLDAAGYPAHIVLPPGYQAPAASPLVPLDVQPKAEPEAATPSPTQPQAPAGNAPAGFRF